MKRIFLFAGEASGDLHGDKLIEALKVTSSDIRFSGVGGPAMRSKGIQGPLIMEDFQVMGFTDVLCALPKLYRQFNIIKNAILNEHPDTVILIDYPGFNLRLAKALRKNGYHGKIVQYISPTVWAHGQGRIKTLCDNVDLLLTIYPFEKAYYPNSAMQVHYVGNPLVETIKTYRYSEAWADALGLDTTNLIALFPGSREGEINRNLPIMLKALENIQAHDSTLHIGLSVGHNSFNGMVEAYLKNSSLKNIKVVPSRYNYELMRDSKVALAKSGTVTLELALHGRPTVVIYSLTQLNYFIAKYLLSLKLPHYCIVNILAATEVFPEIIGTHLSADTVAKALDDIQKVDSFQQKLANVKDNLGAQNAHQEAARAIIQLLNK